MEGNRRARPARSPNRGRALRLAVGTASLGVALVAVIAAIPSTPVRADTLTTAVDRSAYVPNPNSAPDAYWTDSEAEGGYSGPDPVDIHVAAQPQQVTYYGLIHLELDAIPPDANVTSLVVTMVPDIPPATRPADTVNASAAIIDAYPLKTELPPAFQGCSPPPAPTATNPNPAPPPCTPPAYDTTFPAVVAKAGAKPSSDAWTIDVGSMLPYWQKLGTNTGLAIVPNAAATTQPWAIAFNRDKFLVSATYIAPGSSTAVTITTPSSAGGEGAVTNPGTTPVTPSTPVASAAASPSPRPSRAPAISSVGVPPAGSGGVPLWLVVFGISGAAAVALLAQPVSQALSASVGLRAGLFRELSVHPRMFAVAGVLVVWSSAWGVYSGVTGAGAGPASATRPGGGGSGIPSYLSPDQTQTPGASAGPTSSSGGSGSGGAGGGGSATGASAFGSLAAQFNPPAANLFGAQDDTTGLSNNTIQLCGHSALTFASAFNIGPQDLNVFWDTVNNPSTDPYHHTAGQGGIWNRRVVLPGTSTTDANPADSSSFNNQANWGVQVNDDGYQPSEAVGAAQKCQDQSGGDFFLLSGIGFDQIPAVRVWSEQNHMLYIHQVAASSSAYRYSFTMMPTVEQIGTNFGQYYLAHNRNLKVGIIYRNSSNWDPGRLAFVNVLQQAGLASHIVDQEPVDNNQGDYTAQINKIEAQGAQIVFVWENALYAEQIIQQANNQAYDPQWLLFPFNLTLYTLYQANVPQSDLDGMQGIYNLPAYTAGSGVNCQQPPKGSGITRKNADYQANLAEIEQFEAAYNKWDPNADLCGDGGDLLFTTYEYSKQIADLIDKCGPECTRNKIAGEMLDGYHSQVGANCPVDFRGGDGHHGASLDDVYGVKQENGGPGWVNSSLCVKTVT